ncbi:MAG: hypothetical protein L6Q95_06510 [Planctomycetes bacterium]|nr:hypothetical protein [Planctomycetota bacterium]
MRAAILDEKQAADAVNRLVDEYRVRCLWFLREDFYPSTLAERLQALGYIERHGDLEAFRRAAELKRWLSRNSNAPSAGS